MGATVVPPDPDRCQTPGGGDRGRPGEPEGVATTGRPLPVTPSSPGRGVASPDPSPPLAWEPPCSSRLLYPGTMVH